MRPHTRSNGTNIFDVVVYSNNVLYRLSNVQTHIYLWIPYEFEFHERNENKKKPKERREKLVKNVEYIGHCDLLLWSIKYNVKGTGIGIKIAILNLSSISTIFVIYSGMPFKSRHNTFIFFLTRCFCLIFVVLKGGLPIRR